VYLTDEERAQFSNQPLQYLVRQVTTYEFPSITSRRFVELQTHNPIERLIIVPRRSDSLQYRNQVSNFSNWINPLKPPFIPSAGYPALGPENLFSATGQFVLNGQRAIIRALSVLGDGNLLQEEKPLEYFQINNIGTIKILENSRRSSVKKFVYAASSSCYGLAETPTTEESLIAPQYPYALSKYLGEMAAFHWNMVYKLPINSICIFNAYGPRVKTTGAYGAVFGVFLKQKLSGKPFTVVGDGKQSRDFVHVSDVANAFLLAAETSISGERFNVGAGNPMSVNYLVELLGGKVTYIPKRPGEPEVTYADISKISRLLNWSPKVKFEVGVRQMVEQINDWASAPLWDEVTISNATKKWFEFMDSSSSKDKPV
jgi:UDP-glucose 4-epimerase